ncbi:hypothetical protein AB0H88_00490 [Nonomuraea sp. NPDC050680]
MAIPHQSTTNPAPISQHQRLAVLRRLAWLAYHSRCWPLGPLAA